MDSSNPLYVHPSDGRGSLPIQEKLVGAQNYRSWRRSIEISLSTERKLGFVKDTIPRPVSLPVTPENAVVRAVNAVNEELDSMTTLPRLSTITPEMFVFLSAVEKQKEEQRLFQFLNVIQQEESQKDVFSTSLPVIETTALLSKSGGKDKCSICGFKWHPPDKCMKPGATSGDCTDDELEFVAEILPKITLPNRDSSEITQIGQVRLKNGILLKDVLCVPTLKFSLLFVPKLTKDNNCVAIFFPTFCMIQDLRTRKVQGLGRKIGGQYHLLNVPIDQVDAKLWIEVENSVNGSLFSCFVGVYNKTICHSMYSLWHHMLGHISITKMKHVQCSNVPLVNESHTTCLTYPMAKLTKLPCAYNDSCSSAVATWTYLIVHKSNAFEVIKAFLKFVELQFDTKVKCIRPDNALEFVKCPCAMYLANQGIEHQITYVDRPQQNGRVERKHRHILEVARALRFQASGFGDHYKGQLLWSGELIQIDAQRWNKEWDEKQQQFWMEISMLSSLKHKNLVSLIGFCDENDEKIIIIRRENMGSLEKHLSDSTRLTWVRRLEICVGLAHGLSYIHYDEQRDFSVIHRNIDSETVLLNDNLEPRLSEFRLSIKIKASQRHLSFDTGKVSNRLGCTDPTYFKTKRAHHKSDMYSFGIVMFELLCGRKALIDDHQDNKYLASVGVVHYREKKLKEIIDWNLWKQMDTQSFNICAEIAYNCLNEERSQRLNIDEIVTRLETALELQLKHQIDFRCNPIYTNITFDLISCLIPHI
ncbi:kinase-like domain, phloem protein 2-like protein [Tanacetum coccineum]